MAGLSGTGGQRNGGVGAGCRSRQSGPGDGPGQEAGEPGHLHHGLQAGGSVDGRQSGPFAQACERNVSVSLRDPQGQNAPETQSRMRRRCPLKRAAELMGFKPALQIRYLLRVATAIRHLVKNVHQHPRKFSLFRIATPIWLRWPLHRA